MTSQQDGFLFEVSWEVCNKVGGIYTVLQSKARYAVTTFGENYYVLGPNLKTNREFEETDEECWQKIREAVGLRNIPCRFGRWAIPGRPKAILVDFSQKYNREQLFYQLWEQYGVDSISGGWDYMEPVMFSYACGEVIETIYQLLARPAGAPAVAQFHEWMCGAGLMCIKKRCPEIGTVFTTHATILGRALAGSGVDIYREMDHISPQKEAAAHNIMAKFSMESASAREADCFTTVSEITATEAKNLLGRKPDVILPNGLDIAHIPDLAQNRQPALEARDKLMAFARNVLGRPVPAEARFLIISGRYEFHNKGIDVFLEALARLQHDIPPDRSVIAFLFVMGGHREINPALLPEGAAARQANQPLLVTHRLYNEGSDPILETCSRLGMRNAADSRVSVIFLPAFLDGHDGLLNMHYYEALSACDMGVFPSFYEPWGYTPLESAAFAVPTVTTDQAGFGLWARDTLGENHGVLILNRQHREPRAIVEDLHSTLKSFLLWSDPEMNRRRAAARQIASHASWAEFFKHYQQAYEFAARGARSRVVPEGAAGPREARHTFLGTASIQPHFRNLSAVAHLPEEIRRLREIAYNLWWTWNPEALELFSLLDPRLWTEMGNNPVRMLETISPDRLQEMARNEEYVALYSHVVERFDDYMGEKKQDKQRRPRSARIQASSPIAYFSAEYGLHECLPIYSGGLGVLSGDHLKAASDLNIPLVGVGLLYKSGFFRQRIDKDGWQVADYPASDFTNLPVKIVQDERGNDIQISVELPGRALHAAIWEIRVGRVSLYLLDTDIPRNTAQDRAITGCLYCADRRIRMEQEILLGMGGIRMLKRLGIQPAIYHINEGHSAFLLLERISHLMTQEGLAFDEAREVVRSTTVFTTHTPVEAGNERFDRDIIEYYFSSLVQRAGMTWSQFWDLGRRDSGDDKPFFMTILGLKLSYRSNGVSRMHAAVCRRMWNQVWKGFPPSDVPVRHVTNGVHVPSYVGGRMRRLLDTYVGLHWQKNISDAALWKRIHDVPDAQLWQAKCGMKQDLIELVRENISQHWVKYGDNRSAREDILAGLNPSALLIGFARRFAPYKRAGLVLSDLDRLNKIINHEKRPVCLIFAGKAHPNDGMGIDLLKRVIEVGNDPRFRGKIIFLEDYSLRMARALLQGVDVWLNTPTRPYEASGTSGQKAAVNGTLNLSVSDGWWCEGYDGSNGWTIGPVMTGAPAEHGGTDEEDRKALYALLEDTVCPLFFDRDDSGLPRKWLNAMKHSIETLVPQFNTDRMLRQYFEELYQPAAERGAEIAAGSYHLARQVAEWKRKVPMRFSSLRIVDVSLEGIHGDSIAVGQSIVVKVRIDPGKIDPAEILAEFLIGKVDSDEISDPPKCVVLHLGETKNGLLLFSAEHTISENGRYYYGIRVMPYNKDLATKQEAELVLWG